MQHIDTGTPDLLAEVDDGVAVVTMNRPERRNALSRDMAQALAAVLRQLELDDGIGVVVLTGAGGAFCAGGDVKAMAEGSGLFGRSPDQALRQQRENQRQTAGRLWSQPKPTIAMIPGPAAGAGLALAMACDLRYAADTAVLTTAFAKVALPGDYGGSWFLTRLVGSARAKELYYFSPQLTAAQARELGLVTSVFPAPELDSAVRHLARELADGPRLALRYMKENLNRAVHADLDECLDLEVTHLYQAAATQDHREAARAFTEKRPPTYRR